MKLDSYALSFHSSVEALSQRDPAGAREPAGMPGDSTRRPTEFVAVEGGSDNMSGETLLVEAYAALWVILFGFVFVSWRRQSRIDARVAELERAVGQGQTK
jgi:CcmD family protein